MPVHIRICLYESLMLIHTRVSNSNDNTTSLEKKLFVSVTLEGSRM